MSAEVFVVVETPAPLAGMALPGPDTNWAELHRRGFRFVVRLHPAAYDPAPLVVHDFALEDLYGGRMPADAAAEERTIWAAAGLAAEAVTRGDGVVVHCLGGTGRTGTVLACALRLLGFSLEEAMATVASHRPRWPESPWQEAVVRRGPAVP